MGCLHNSPNANAAASRLLYYGDTLYSKSFLPFRSCRCFFG